MAELSQRERGALYTLYRTWWMPGGGASVASEYPDALPGLVAKALVELYWDWEPCLTKRGLETAKKIAEEVTHVG